MSNRRSASRGAAKRVTLNDNSTKPSIQAAPWQPRFIAWLIDLNLSFIGLFIVVLVVDGIVQATHDTHVIAAGWLALVWLMIWAILDGVGYIRFGVSIGQHLVHLQFEMMEEYSRRWLWLRLFLVWLSFATSTFPLEWLLVTVWRRPLHDRWSHCRLIYEKHSL